MTTDALEGAAPTTNVTVRAAYEPEPYHQDADETVECPECGRMNDDDAEFCDQCGVKLAGRADVTSADDDGDSAEDLMGGTHSESGVGSEYDSKPHPKDSLVRARVGAGIALRMDGQGTPTELYGTFSQFNSWYEVDSLWEGHFLERVAPGAFKDTIQNDRSGMRVLFDHGMDPHLGFKPLGPIRTLEEREDGPYYEVPLLDTDYNRDFVIPALTGRLMDGTLAGSQLGASFRFMVQDEEWNRQGKKTSSNPQGLPQRTITRAKVFEFGPVTFPANAGASAAARSDVFLARLSGDARFLAEFTERVGSKVSRRILEEVPLDLRAALASEAPRIDPERLERLQLLRRRARAILATSS